MIREQGKGLLRAGIEKASGEALTRLAVGTRGIHIRCRASVKAQVRAGTEIHGLRTDRYYLGVALLQDVKVLCLDF